MGGRNRNIKKTKEPPFITVTLPYEPPEQIAYPSSSNFRDSLQDVRAFVEATRRTHSLRGYNGNQNYLSRIDPKGGHDSVGKRCCRHEEEEGISNGKVDEQARFSHPLCYCITDDALCVYDKYPKARHHVLLIPSSQSILKDVESIQDLVPKIHLPALREFHSLARQIADSIEVTTRTDSSRNNGTGRGSGGKRRRISAEMILGYHAIPSINLLHLHILSRDMASVCVKTKKHIQSFTTEFFVDIAALENHLESAFVDSLKIHVREERAREILKQSLKCFRCNQICGNVPEWKRHVASCDGQLRFPSRGVNSLLGWSSDNKGSKSFLENWLGSGTHGNSNNTP